ncbi:endonuclease VII [Mycobacterium phage Phabba]|uniref:HNH endonuclease n=1 Tax=Mycobacterium phage Phabba TaxID=2027899 RepID=A0A249XSC6_9CAUD|nr:endonuclease VII [Mycobacterium phage Phabba]ASZ74628.1 HNH endonuclease [Mycobacterium phage Phabba]
MIVVKTCAKCHTPKPLTEFGHRTVKGKRYPVSYCRLCMNAYNRDRRTEGYRPPNIATTAQNTRYAWLRRLRKLGITEADYEALVIMQDGKCAICRTDKPWTRSDMWCVDHDHVTGAVRGLLCHACNSGIGHLKDDPIIVETALQYLLHHSSPQLTGPPGRGSR